MTRVRTYLDFNATAPLRPQARAAMIAALDEAGNPSSVHSEGRRARALVEGARASVASLVNAKPQEVVFTSGATEANVWALSALSGHVLSSPVEHPSVLAPLQRAAEQGSCRVSMLPVDGFGRVLAHALFNAEAAGASLLSLQLANNETGVLQPLDEIAALKRETESLAGLHLHCDGVQALGRVALDFTRLPIATLALSSHKIGGPKGVGALVIRDGHRLAPLLTGGGQERRHRAGTENVAAIAGFGAAAREALAELGSMPAIAARRDRFEARIAELAPETVVIGRGAPRLANTSSIALPGRSAETLVIKLDLMGFAVSAGAACSSGKVGHSHVLSAMGLPADVVSGAVRISIGAQTTDDELDRFAAAWAEIAGAKLLAA